MSCNCFVAKHPQAAEIEAALREGQDPRTVAERFSVGKSKVYEHRRHLLGSGPFPAQDAPRKPPPEQPKEPVEREARSMEQPAPFHGTADSATRAQPQVVDIQRGTPFHGAGYEKAVEAAAGLISGAQWRASHIQGLAEKFGLTTSRARQAYYEATRGLRMNLGGHAERLEVSVAWLMRQRDEARGKGDAREKLAEEWRRRERTAADEAERAGDPETKADRLNDAARFGSVAAKYGMEAEKWHAQALAHQRHLDDIQCLKTPAVYAASVTFGDEHAALDRLGAALAARFADRPEVLAEINAAASGLDSVIETTGEAA